MKKILSIILCLLLLIGTINTQIKPAYAIGESIIARVVMALICAGVTITADNAGEATNHLAEECIADNPDLLDELEMNPGSYTWALSEVGWQLIKNWVASKFNVGTNNEIIPGEIFYGEPIEDVLAMSTTNVANATSGGKRFWSLNVVDGNKELIYTLQPEIYVEGNTRHYKIMKYLPDQTYTTWGTTFGSSSTKPLYGCSGMYLTIYDSNNWRVSLDVWGATGYTTQDPTNILNYGSLEGYGINTSYEYIGDSIIGDENYLTNYTWLNEATNTDRQIAIPESCFTDGLFDPAKFYQWVIGKTPADVYNTTNNSYVEENNISVDMTETNGLLTVLVNNISNWPSQIYNTLYDTTNSISWLNTISNKLTDIYNKISSIPSDIANAIADIFVPTLDLSSEFTGIKNNFELKTFGLPGSIPFTQYLVDGQPPIIYITNPINQEIVVLIDFADYIELFGKIRTWCGGIMIVITCIWFIRTFRPQQTVD